MSRLHTVRATIAEVVAHFGIETTPAISVPDETVLSCSRRRADEFYAR